MLLLRFFAAACCLCATQGLALAQATPQASETDGWRFEIVPYFWAASLDGTIGLGALPEVDVDAGFEDLFENLDFAAATFFTARKGRFALLGDLSYTGLEIEESVAASNVEIDSDVYWASLAGGYRFAADAVSDIDVFAGLRYYAVDNKGRSSGGVTASHTHNEAWIDPLVGFNLVHRLAPSVGLEILADVGGFGVGSDLTYQLMPSLSFRISEPVSIRLGYRWMDVDYEDSDFVFDVRETGFLLGVGIAF